MAKKKNTSTDLSKTKVTWTSSNENYKALSRGNMPTKATWAADRREKKKQKEQQEEIKRQREESFNRTKEWQKRYNDAKYSPDGDQSWQIYAAKQILDTPGALEKEQERQREIGRRNMMMVQSNFGTPTRGGTLKNELTEKAGPYRTQQKALNNYISNLKKQKSMERNPIVDQATAIRNAENQQKQKMLAALEELYKKNQKVSGAGHERWESNKAEIGTPSIGSYNSMNANRLNEKQQGIYDIGTNPMYMSGAGLDNFYSKWNQQAADTRKKAEEYRNAGYAGLFDYIEGLDRQNEETILHGNYTPEQQATAYRTLKELNDTYDARKEAAIENGQRTINGYAKYGPEMFAQTMQSQTKDWLYYLLTGEDYAKRTANMTQEQKAELDEQIEKARESVLNYSQDEYDSMLREADADEHIARQVLEEKATRGKIDEFTNWSRHYDSAEYDPSLVETRDWFDEMLTDPIKEPVGSREDKAYYYMNNRPEEGAPGNYLDYLKKEYFATPEMVDTYNRLFKADKENGTNMAGAFLDAIDPYLTGWETEYTDYFIRNRAENPLSGIAMRLMSYPINAVNAIPSIINAGVAFFDKNAANPNKGVNLVNKITTTTREEQNKDIDTALGGTGAVEYLLGIADSIGDNVMAMGTSGLVTGDVSSKAGMRVVQLIMSGEATGHTFLEKLEEKKDPTEAAIYAIGDGIIEAITEKYSLEALLNPDVKSMLGNTKQLMKYFGKVSLAEGSEEIASDLLNWGLDSILSMAFDHETELKERYYELIESGMGEQEASRQALLEKFEQIGMSGLAGGISGGLMGMGRAGINYIGNLQAGSQINDAKNIDKMVDIGLRADEGTISRTNAEAVQKRITEGKKVSDAEAGKLAQSIMLETNESFSEKSKEARTTEIARMLRAKGMSAADAQSMSETLDKAVMAGGIENLSKAEQRKINNNKAASSVYNKLAYNAKTQTKVNTKIDAATEAEQRVHNAVSSMFTRTQEMGAKYVGRNRATEDDLRKATGTEVKGPMGVIVLNADRFDNAKLTGVRKVNGQIKYTVEIDGKEQNVDASQIRARNIGTAAIIEKSTNDPHLYNMGYTNKLLQVMNTLAQQEQPDALMMDAYRMRMAAFKGQAMPKALINEKAAKELYDYSRIEYQAIRQEETKEANRNALKPGQGTATFAGYQFGTKEFDDALDSSNMSESEKEKIRVYAALSKAAGTQVAFRSIEEIQQMALTDEDMSIFKEEENKLYGAESKSGILINLGGENITTDPVTGEKKYSKHDIGVTYGHEFLHYLQRNSLKGYNDIVKYVFDTQAKNKGEAWVNQQLEKYMRDQDIDLNEAIFEFVADSCDSIFSSKEVIDHIVNTNKTLYGEIKSFIKDLFTRVRAALANMRGSMSEAGAQMINTNYRALGKLVNVAWDEAASGQVITPEEYQQMVAEETGTKTAEKKKSQYVWDKYEGESLYKDSSIYDYDFLVALPDIEYVPVQSNISKYITANNETDRINLRKDGLKIAEQYGKKLPGTDGVLITNKYTGRNMRVTGRAITHGVTKKANKKSIANARAGLSIGQLARDAVPINGLKTTEQYVKGTYAMAAPIMRNNNVTGVALLTVEIRTGTIVGIDTFDQIHSANTRKKSGVGLGANTPAPLSTNQQTGSTSTSRSSTMSIKNFLDLVNDTFPDILSADVLNKLGNANAQGYWQPRKLFSRAMAEDISSMSMKDLNDSYMAAVENGNTQRQQELVYEAGDRAGYSIRAFHGTARGDRVGTEFKPERATSGPMAFFTDDRGIAENYARDKNDTSIAYDEEYGDYYNQFRTTIKGKSVPIGNLWNTLSYTKRQKMLEDARHITWDDEVENIIYDKNARNSNGGLQDYLLREKKGNVIEAMVYAWLESGDLYNKEEMFLDVLKLMGIDNVKWNNPDERHEKVYDVLLNIQNPFVVNEEYTNEFVDDLEAWWEEQDQDAYIKETYNTDLWDKNNRTVEEWADIARDNIENNRTTAWTSIPDAVSDYLRSKGYDGIKDEGGKGGGSSHTVWIPFRSEQIKSADPVTYDDNGNVIPLSERFNNKKTDIRWSRAQADIDSRQQELSEAWQKARDDADALREQVRAMKPEMDAWTNKLTEAMNNGTFDELMPEYKEWEKGYTKLNNDLYEAEQRYKEANRAYDDYIEERDVAEEQAKIKASGLSEADYRRKQAVEEFGYTTDFREAGYLLPNGKMLNFTGEKGKHYGTRGEDHRGIGRIYASRENQGGAAMFAFMKDGNIRVMAETPGIDLITTIEPTREQYEQIRNMARRFAGEHYFNVDLTDEHGYTDDSIEYDGRVDPNKVVNDIKSYYKTGVVPTQSTVSQFHYSRWTESGMDVNYWMEHATPSMVQTEDERELISMYRGKRTSISLSLKKQGEYRARIRQLEAVDNPSTDVKSELTALRNKLEIEKKKVYRLEEEILQITRNDGWAGMMYQHNMVFRDYVEGRTQEQVRQTIDDMLKLVEQTQEQVTKDTENLKKLATHQAVQTMKSFMGKTSMGRMASILRKTYNSTMNKAEIEDRLAEMALKQASGKDITSDTEALAQDLLDRMRGIRTDTLESLRGQTFVIGQSLADELRKENSSIKELQSRIKGSGIKIVTGVKSSTGEIDKHSRISEQWSELRESNAALPDVENMAEIDKLHTIVDFIESELRASTGAEQFGIDFDEVAAMVRASVGNITTYLTDDPKARAQINNLMKQIADLSKATEKTAADMQGLYGKLDDVMQAGARAKGIATAMERDVNEAIKYYNTTARVAAEKERTKVRKALIAQLRDENTQKLLKQQEKYRSMIENNQKARELHLDNEALRRKISTVASRMANRLFAETDQKNVPEETKGLVREVLRMLSENDSVYRKVTNWDKDRIEDAMKRLNRLNLQNGEFVPAKDLDFLVVKAPNEADNDYTMRDKVWQDILDIESGLEEYRAAETSTLVNQQAKNDALTKVQEALSEIYSVIRARSEAFINGRRYEIATLAEQMENEMAGSKYKGERTGKIGRAFNTIEKMVGYGNLTPEYFFKNLKNGVMKILHGGFHDAEQRAGLEALRAKAVVEKIAKDTKYNTWDPQEKHKVKLPGGREIDMTTEQIMALYATWRRESSQLRPEETAHLLKGGFVLAQGDMTEGLYGRQKNDQRPIRMDKATLEGLRNYLTEDQLRYVVELVNYMSGELAEIGNETSMQQYGIKKFTERYYYPIKAWGGVLNKSSASGVENKSDARAMRQSFTKNLTANAQNAIEIGDFTPTVMKHIVGMITFNTVGPAVENMNKVLNQQLTYGEAVYDENGEIAEDNRYKRNVRAVFQDAYGVNALKYLERFMDDVNGGMTRQQDKSLQEKLLSVFRKGAVAGSLSVAAQQPLSYIRAAMKINPVYLARALAPTHWGKIHDEMLKYSGVAVIKDMGRFDMNQGQSMIDYITPEEKISKARKAGRTAAEMTTILPEKMDALTWGRMWIACKLETAAKNKGMDQKSDEFLQKVAQRFNEVMRQTQVYDSMMVKSQNMRSTNYAIKAMTSFMAEPSLSLNVLADAVRNFNEKGGKLNMGKAAATFIVSAALQALVKAIMSSGRSPDKKKKFEEQFLTKWHSLFMSEVDPLTLIPGYSDIIELFKNGELADDAWGALGKFKTIAQTGIKWATGKSDDHYRNFEDTVGQLAQLMTNVPLKNLMRDGRAIYNFFNPETYAKREYSSAMTKYGIKDSFYTADNMIGLVNSYLQMAGAGYGTTANDYYERIYGAEKAGNKQDAESMREYVLLKSTAEDPQKSMDAGLRKLAKNDDSLTAAEKYQKQKEYGLVKGGSYIKDEYEAGNLTRKEAEKLYRQENPKASDKDVLAAFDKIDYEKKTGKEIDSYSNYMPLYDAISNNRSDEIKEAAKHMMDNGYKAEDIKSQLSTKYRQAYLDAKGSEKTRLMDALTKAYKAIGLSAEDALKIINGWKPKKETKK